MFCNPGPQSKIGRAIGILLISKFGWGFTKTVVESRVLVRRIFFYIIWKLLWMALFWATAFDFWVPPSWPKMALNPKETWNWVKINLNNEGGTEPGATQIKLAFNKIPNHRKGSWKILFLSMILLYFDRFSCQYWYLLIRKVQHKTIEQSIRTLNTKSYEGAVRNIVWLHGFQSLPTP